MKLERGLWRFKKYAKIHWMLFWDKRTPLITKILLVLTIIYILSPWDIIPDFIPFAGMIDEIIIIPLMLYIAMRFIPKEVTDDGRRKLEAVNKR